MKAGQTALQASEQAGLLAASSSFAAAGRSRIAAGWSRLATNRSWSWLATSRSWSWSWLAASYRSWFAAHGSWFAAAGGSAASLQTSQQARTSARIANWLTAAWSWFAASGTAAEQASFCTSRSPTSTGHQGQQSSNANRHQNSPILARTGVESDCRPCDELHLADLATVSVRGQASERRSRDLNPGNCFVKVLPTISVQA